MRKISILVFILFLFTSFVKVWANDVASSSCGEGGGGGISLDKKEVKRRQDLSGEDLRGHNLRRVKACGKNFSKANLAEADLTGADLSEANLTGADLSGANLNGAYLFDANLTGANLTGVDFTKTYSFYLKRANFNKANLRGLTSVGLS